MFRVNTEKKGKQEATKIRDAGGDEKHMFVFTWPNYQKYRPC